MSAELSPLRGHASTLRENGKGTGRAFLLIYQVSLNGFSLTLNGNT